MGASTIKSKGGFMTKMNLLQHIPNYLFIGVINAYRFLISPVLAGRCRYEPTCSQYALESLKKHGPAKGLWMTIKRIGRCHPWGSSGYDPVPSSNKTCYKKKFVKNF